MRLTCVFCTFFFFFKQKTAYEMRISDWSSDVCSSDLVNLELHTFGARDIDSRDSFKTAIANVERFKADHSVNGLVVHVPLQSVAVVTSRDFDADQCLRSIEFADREIGRAHV